MCRVWRHVERNARKWASVLISQTVTSRRTWARQRRAAVRSDGGKVERVPFEKVSATAVFASGTSICVYERVVNCSTSRIMRCRSKKEKEKKHFVIYLKIYKKLFLYIYVRIYHDISIDYHPVKWLLFYNTNASLFSSLSRA